MIPDLAIIDSGDLPRAAHALHDSPIQYHACGSRFFGHATDQSDWDFVAAFTPEVVQNLQENDFQINAKDMFQEYLFDDLTCAVFQRDNVQVALVVDIARKLAARDGIRHWHPEYHASRLNEERTRLWNMWYNLLSPTPDLYKDGEYAAIQGKAAAWAVMDSKLVGGWSSIAKGLWTIKSQSLTDDALNFTSWDDEDDEDDDELKF